jgi:hypothetical protein
MDKNYKTPEKVNAEEKYEHGHAPSSVCSMLRFHEKKDWKNVFLNPAWCLYTGKPPITAYQRRMPPVDDRIIMIDFVDQ